MDRILNYMFKGFVLFAVEERISAAKWEALWEQVLCLREEIKAILLFPNTVWVYPMSSLGLVSSKILLYPLPSVGRGMNFPFLKTLQLFFISPSTFLFLDCLSVSTEECQMNCLPLFCLLTCIRLYWVIEILD